jgi:hypothetical protein
MQLKVPQLTVKQAGLQTISIGQLGIGPISVGSLALSNIGFTLNAAHALLQDVNVTVTIKITVEWHIHIGLPDGIPDINIGDTYDLGSFDFSLPVGNITIPSLSNLKFEIPSVTAQNLSLNASPLGVQLTNVAADNIHAADAVLPQNGFTIAGLALGSLSGGGIGVPAATVGQATVQHLHGDPAKIPSLALGGLQLPAVQIPSIMSTIPLSIPADLQGPSPGFDAGILKLAIHIYPSVLMRIEHLQIMGATADASVGQAVLHDVTLPYDALNLTLSQIGIDTIDIPGFTLA